MSHPNDVPAMTWHQHIKDVHAHLKKTNPNATLKQAMLEGRGSYRAMKDRLYDARKHVIAVSTSEYKKKPRGQQREALKEKAERMETRTAADVLAMMRHDDIPRLNFR